MMHWVKIHPKATPEMLGYLPRFLSEDDPRSAKEQINANYISGWHSFEGFTMRPNGNLVYSGDPVTRLLYMTALRHERIQFYENAWVAIIQPDGSFEVARID